MTASTDTSGQFRGFDAAGHRVVVGWMNADGSEYLVGLTKCCNAAVTACDGEIVCKACYEEADPLLGGPAEVDSGAFLLRLAHDGVAVEPTIATVDRFHVTLCPTCHREIEEAWADDGESDDADWWQCSHCGAHGAFVKLTDPTATLNGIPVDRDIPSSEGAKQEEAGPETVSATLDGQILGAFTRDEWNTIASSLDLLAGLDEGENTDYDALVALRDRILTIPGVH